VLNKNPTPKEIRYCKKIGLEIVDADVLDLLNAVGFGEDYRKMA
jgi:hypothetical protein